MAKQENSVLTVDIGGGCLKMAEFGTTESGAIVLQRFAVKEFEDRMFFGTDIVFPDMPIPLIDALKRWKRDGIISASAYNKITHENAMRFLKL